MKEIIFHMHFNKRFLSKYWHSVVSKFSSDNETVTFPEYLFGFWNFLSLRPLQKTYDKFTFDLYAEKSGKNQGSLSSNCALMLLDDIYDTKKDFIYKKATKALRDPKALDWYTLAQWSQFTGENEGVLLPLQDLQKKERFKLLGKTYWEKKVDARKNFSRGKSYLTLAETFEVAGIATSGNGSGGGERLKPSSSGRGEKLVRKPSSRGGRGMGPRSHSQGTLSQGGSSNSISVDG